MTTRRLVTIPHQGLFLFLAATLSLLGGANRAHAEATISFSHLPCAVFVDLPAPEGSATPFLPFSVPLCGGGELYVTTRSYPLRPQPYTDEPYSTGTFNYSNAGTKEEIDPAVNPGDYRGRFQSRATVGWDLLLDFDVPIASFGMSTMQTRFVNCVSDRMQLFDGPHGTGELIAEVYSQGPPASPYFHAVRFTGYNAGAPVIRSVVIDVQSDVDGRLFLDGLAFGQSQSTTSAPATPPPLVLHPAAPNPFNPRTTIRYDLAVAGTVSLRLFDLRGRMVRELAQGPRPAGAHAVLLDGDDLASGIYLVRLEGPGGVQQAQRITLVR